MCARFCTSLCEIESCRHFFSKVWALFGPPTSYIMDGKDYQGGSVDKDGNMQINSATTQEEDTTPT